MGKRVNFDQPANAVEAPVLIKSEPSGASYERHAIAHAKAKYRFPWWASENPLEVFWGQLNEETKIVPVGKLLEVARQAMGREVLESELTDREALVDELSARIPAKTLGEVRVKISVQNASDHGNSRETTK
jgi:hypothetical protein